MRSRYTILSLLLAFAGTGLLWGEMHSWTLRKTGKTIDAEFVDTVDDRVILLIKGQETSIKFSKLSDEDQAYVQELAERMEEHKTNKNFSERWPTSTHMEDKLRARAVVEDAASDTYIYETTHFRFISPVRLNLATVSEMGRVFEGTYTACRAIPLNFPCRRFDAQAEPGDEGGGEPQEKLAARLFRTKAEYVQEIGSEFASSSGIFREPEILVPFESLGIVKKGKSYAMESQGKLDTDTLIHELTHQMTLLGATYDVPIWFAEGMAEYMRLVTYKRGHFNFKGIHKNIVPYFVGGPGTTSRQLGRKLVVPPLERLLNLSVREFQSARGDDTQFNYGFSALVTYYFIHLDGKGDAARLKRWMRHLQTTERATAKLSIKIPADSSPAEIEAAQAFLQQQALNIREDYHYEPLLDGRSWRELEEEFSHKVAKELGITIHFKHAND